MKQIECYECEGAGEHEFCLDCDMNVDVCMCSDSSGAYTEDCIECDGDGCIDEEED